MNKNYAALLAEFIGTFGLSFIVGLSLLGGFPLPVPVVAALTLGIFVYTIGNFSGAQINPAVTIGLLSVKKINSRVALGYLIAQGLAGLLAMYCAHAFGVRVLDLPSNTLQVGLAELIGTFFFTFGIAAVVSGKVNQNLSGIVVGGSLLLGIIFASATGSLGILNPAVALAISMLSPMYLVGPILGSILGFNTYEYLNRLAKLKF